MSKILNDIMKYRSQLTDDQVTFFTELSKYPEFCELWDVENRQLKGPLFDRFTETCDYETRILLDFFRNVWSKDDIKAISLIDIGHLLEDEDRQVIARWIVNPYYP